MKPARTQRLLSAALGAGLSLGLPLAAHAQVTTGPGLSSGSGAGTGTGSSAPGLGGTGTGQESGRLGGTGSGMESTTRQFDPTRPSLGGPQPRNDPQGMLESLRDPALGLPITGLKLNRRDVERISAELYDRARALTDPGQRSEALERAARTHIHAASDARNRGELPRLEEARAALIESWQALRAVPDRVAHDVRSISLISTMTLLGEAYQSLALVNDPPLLREEEPKEPSMGRGDRLASLGRSTEAYDLAARVAAEIIDPNYRSETIYRIAENQARSGSQIALAKIDPVTDSPGAPVEAALPLDKLADRSLEAAAQHALTIRRPVWRDRALLTVGYQAASGNRFGKGLEVVRRIPHPQVRADGLVRIAETQARHQGQGEAATATYQEAARSVASIEREDPRAILADVLINSLMLSGRFDDARASTVLFRDPGRRFESLSTIAEMMGRRGLDQEARAWIARDIAPAQQSMILRRMSDGMIASIEQYRTTAQAGDLSGYNPLDNGGSRVPNDTPPPPPQPEPSGRQDRR